MKYAEEIVKEIEERGPIDTTGCIVDKNDDWEDYIRRTGHVPREKRKPCINYSDGCDEWAGCPCVYYKTRESKKVGK